MQQSIIKSSSALTACCHIAHICQGSWRSETPCHTDNRMPSKHTRSPNLYSGLPTLRTGQQWAALAVKNLENILNTSQSKPEFPQCHVHPRIQLLPASGSTLRVLSPSGSSQRHCPKKSGSWQCVGAGRGEPLYNRWLYALQAQLPSREGTLCYPGPSLGLLDGALPKHSDQDT